jgi:hypothetical protein
VYRSRDFAAFLRHAGYFGGMGELEAAALLPGSQEERNDRDEEQEVDSATGSLEDEETHEPDHDERASQKDHGTVSRLTRRAT